MMTVDECVAKARKVVAAHTKAKLIEYAGLLVESGLPLDEVAAESSGPQLRARRP